MPAATPVFDFVPYGAMMESFNDERLRGAIEDALDAGLSASATFDRLRDAQVRALATDPSFGEALREVYRGAGVSVITPTMLDFAGDDYAEGVRRDLARWHGRFDALDWLHRVSTPAEARRVAEEGDVGVVPNTQNLGAAIDGDVDEIDRLHGFGIRIAQLTYNRQNLVGTGCYDRSGGGLSQHGIEAVARLNDLGVVIDLSHVGHETTMDAIDASDDPVAFTHTFCTEITDNPRGKRDAAIRALSDADGYMGIQATPTHIAPGRLDEAFDVFLDHLDRAVSILGVDRVGIGTDWGLATSRELPAALRDGLRDFITAGRLGDAPPADVALGFGPMDRYRDWGAIPAALSARGYTDEEVDGLVGGNFVSFWERVVD